MGTTRRDASLTDISFPRAHNRKQAYHARAGENVPAEPDAISVFDLTPLVFERLIIHAEVERVVGGNYVTALCGYETLFTCGLCKLRAANGVKDTSEIW